MAVLCRRNLIVPAALAAGVLTLARLAPAQSWITFTNETTRLSDPEGNYPELLTDSQEKDFAVGDVDNDGDTDMVVVRKIPYTNPGGRKNYLFLNEGGALVNRTAAKIPQFLDLTNDRDVQLFDADGDGWLDIVTATTFPSTGDPASIKFPRLYMNLGNDANGNWLGFQYNYGDQRIPDFPINTFFCSVAVGDVDQDGDLDLFFVDYAADSSVPDPPGGPLKNRLLLNNGSGFFTDVTATNLLPNSNNLDIRGNGFGTRGKIVDMNGDGWVDLIATDTCSANPRTARVAKNMGSANPPQPGVFQTGSWSNFASGNSVYDIDVGDINHDGKLDFYEVDDGNDRLFLNAGNNLQGNPTFTVVNPAGQTAQTTGQFGGNVYFVDMDGDTWLDAIVCDEDVDLGQGGNRMALLHNLGVGPSWLTEAGDPFTSSGLMGTTDTYDVAILDIDGNGSLDLVVGTKTANKVFMNGSMPDTTPPTIVSTVPANGTRDPRQDRNDSGMLQGALDLSITFSEAVVDQATGGPLTPASFTVALTTNLSGLTPPTITTVTPLSATTYRVKFNQPITPGAWTTVVAHVKDAAGNVIAPNGTSLGFLPADVNADSTANTADILAGVNGLNTCAAAGTCSSPEVLAQYDVNRDNTVSTLDLLRTVQLLNGVNTQNVWNGVSLPAQP
ncbi:MAG TPA: FG-GAP-like repeat-containing protein [Phycisphaerae bacterium]